MARLLKQKKQCIINGKRKNDRFNTLMFLHNFTQKPNHYNHTRQCCHHTVLTKGYNTYQFLRYGSAKRLLRTPCVGRYPLFDVWSYSRVYSVKPLKTGQVDPNKSKKKKKKDVAKVNINTPPSNTFDAHQCQAHVEKKARKLFQKTQPEFNKTPGLSVASHQPSRSKSTPNQQKSVTVPLLSKPTLRAICNSKTTQTDTFLPVGLLRTNHHRTTPRVIGGSTVSGFKKLLYHQVMARGYMLYPGFNRRKHNHSYAMVVNNHQVRLGKMYSYLSKNRISAYIGLALKAAWSNIAVVGGDTSWRHNPGKKSLRKTALPFLVGVIESDSALLLLRCQHRFFLRTSRQYVTHSGWNHKKQSIPRTERHLSFGDTFVRHKAILGLNIRTNQKRWHTHGSVLRTS